MSKKSEMRVRDPQSATGWKTVTVKEDQVEEITDKGLSITFIVGAVIALFVILGYPFFLLGKWVYKGIITLGFTELNSLYASLIIGIVYLISILIFSIISRRSKDPAKRKKAKIYVRITAVLLPALSVLAHLWKYFHTYSVQNKADITPLNIGFIIVIPVILGFIFWKITSRFLLKPKLKNNIASVH